MTQFPAHFAAAYDTEFTVDSSYHSLFVPMGNTIVLPCYVGTSLPKEELKVEWRRTNSDALVHVYEDGESRPEKQHQDYHDRAHLFTESMHHGNLSLRLDKTKTEDAGQYTCKVYSKQKPVLSEDVNMSVGFCVPNITKFVPLGDSVVLPCSVGKSLLTEDLKVEWRRTDSKPEAKQQDYCNRAHFFTDQIQLRLDNLTAEDEGEYSCKIYSQLDCVFLSITKLKLGCILEGPSAPLVVPLGSSVVLPCYVDKSLLTEDLKVEWRKTDSGSMVHLYQDGEIRSESQQQDYRDRAHFFTEEIQHGNFSLRLDNLRAEDKGQYICTIYKQHDSVLSTTTRLDSTNEKPVSTLGYIHVFLPNIMMFVAFVFWGVTEGFLYEAICCCALYILRPLALLCVAPYLETPEYYLESEFIIFMVVYFAVLLGRAWGSIVYYAEAEKILIIAVFVVVTLLIVIYIINFFTEDMEIQCHGGICGWIREKTTAVASFSIFILPLLQFAVLMIAFRAAGGVFFIFVLFPFLFFLTFVYLPDDKKKSCSNLLNIISWMILMFIMTAVMLYFYITALTNEKDGAGWSSTAVFVHMLWMIAMYVNYTDEDLDLSFNFKKMLYVFGSVVVVLLNSVTLMTELILKTVNGQRAVGDLRVVVFSSESLFTFFLLILILFGPWISNIKCLLCYQKAARTDDVPVTESNKNQNAAETQNAAPANGSNQMQNTAESHEMETLLKTEDQEAGRSDMTEETPDSVETQT
ncbi:hypothetical protein QQF64_025526 [Cirrhinus molitorella]|uniref:Ig-like domain-containing protein n=1 Tax=Cirrhinus molitorella TaxID=172907 RepID=A0ABR3NPF5_9TELE